MQRELAWCWHFTPWSVSQSEGRQTNWLTERLHCNLISPFALLIYWHHCQITLLFPIPLKPQRGHHRKRPETERRTQSLAGRKKSWRLVRENKKKANWASKLDLFFCTERNASSALVLFIFQLIKFNISLVGSLTCGFCSSFLFSHFCHRHNQWKVTKNISDELVSREAFRWAQKNDDAAVIIRGRGGLLFLTFLYSF